MKHSILKQLSPGYPWGEHLHCFDSIDSTNTQARLMAKQGAPAGTVLIADHQTSGRGRLGRSFHSPGGVGIYFSVILRPQCHATELMHLTCAVAVAACDAVEKNTGLRPGIKWTNDLVHGKHKLGGILTELGLNPNGTVEYAIIGIGINCCQEAKDFPEEIRSIAASLSMVTGKSVDRSRVAAALMEEMYHLDRLTPEKHLLVEMTFWGTMPSYGYSFVDENGETQRFTLEMSGMDGSIYTAEF